MTPSSSAAPRAGGRLTASSSRFARSRPDRPPRPGSGGRSWSADTACSRATTRIPSTPRSRSTRHGWFHTGDIGALTPDGRISYLGRLKDMLKVGGENVAAVEIESYLGTHPAVSIAAVVGVPDPKYVEVAAAFVSCGPAMRRPSRRSSSSAGPASPRSRCPAMSASSPSGRCRRPRSRSTASRRPSPGSSPNNERSPQPDPSQDL